MKASTNNFNSDNENTPLSFEKMKSNRHETKLNGKLNKTKRGTRTDKF